MKKSNFLTKTVLSSMIALSSLMVTTEALACRWYDAPCKAREAAQKAAAEAERLRQEAERARQEAERRAEEARRAAEAAAALAAQQAAAARAAAEEAARAAAAWAAARVPISPTEAASFATSRLNQAGSGLQGLAVSTAQATASGLTRTAGDINWAFRRTSDALDAELRRLNLPIPDVAGFVLANSGPAINQVRSYDAFRRAMGANFARLDSNDLGAIWSVLRTVMLGNRPSDGQMADYRAAFTDLFGDVSNGCAVCPVPMGFPSGVGVALTVSTPTITGSTGLPIPVGGSVTFSLLQSTYLVSGKPLFVAGYAINAEATTAVRTVPEVSMDVAWVMGALSTSKLPLATLSIAVSTPAVESAYGAWSGGGSVGFTTPDAVYMFLDQTERNKLLAALKNPSQGPAYVLEKANQAINELKTMVTNPAIDAGISVGLPGTSAMKLKPDGSLVLSLGGVIASFQ